MNFAKLLLESYSLREQQDDVMQFLISQAPQWNPSSGTPRPDSVSVQSPNNPQAEPILVGVNQKGEVKIEAGPLGSQIVNANRGANPKLLAKLQACIFLAHKCILPFRIIDERTTNARQIILND